MSQDIDRPDDVKFYHHILLVSALILLPCLLGGLFGWMHALLPLLVFYLVSRYGNNAGGKYILFGCLFAGVACIAFQLIEQLMFSLTLIPTGFVIAGAAKKNESIHQTGVKGVITLAGSWLLVTTILAVGLEHHPYTLLLTTLNEGMDEALAYYKVNASMPEETLYLLETTFQQMKVQLPRVMPAILACIVLLIVWFTMVTGNKLLYKKMGISPWPEYRYWSLPEKFVWALIASAVLVILPMEPGRTVGLNMLLVVGLIYCFQGIAIVLFYFYKWSVPAFLRAILYVILFFQSFGTIFLAILGVTDVWFNLRRLRNGEHKTD